MKITVDFNTAMNTAMNTILKNTNYPATEIELVDDPIDFLHELTIISQEYKDKFLSDIEFEFNTHLTKTILDQFAKNGITIDNEDS
ncbi:hypothetical protein [Enterococcus sp. 5B3_DIV0040]|uniref:hypothetical protein n=1 Tax=Enterococcus sp. 5B3_DIV0040 TaxID=1834182 RepID=UPI000A34DBA0|nr:hypothetical protein [Enterococcus sp. 5B3_DIV0040]OTO05340.1 hypothetical protein A5883_002332 [Enterococcus sp. 5B3_DIV0040]